MNGCLHAAVDSFDRFDYTCSKLHATLRDVTRGWVPWQVLYLGAASGTSVSHVSDIVGPDGSVYAVEFSHRSGVRSPAVSGLRT